jgi:hypothetical protein
MGTCLCMFGENVLAECSPPYDSLPPSEGAQIDAIHLSVVYCGV